MKTFLKLNHLVILMSVLLFVSCKKNKDEEPAPKSTQEKIAGKWTLVRETTRAYDNTDTQTSIDEHNGASGEYYEFNSNGSLVLFVAGDLESGKYSVLNETTLSFSDNSGNNTTTWIVKELTDNKAILENTETLESGNKYVTELELKK